MGRINIKIEDSVESQVRAYTRKKGDLGRIVNEALKLWLGEKQK